MYCTQNVSPNSDVRRDSSAIHVLHTEKADASPRLHSEEDPRCVVDVKRVKRKVPLDCFNLCSLLRRRLAKADSSKPKAKANHLSPNGVLRRFIDRHRYGTTHQPNPLTDKTNSDKTEYIPQLLTPVANSKCSSPISTQHRETSESEHLQLSAVLDRCERRLERLCNRIIWLRNTGSEPSLNKMLQLASTQPDRTGDTEVCVSRNSRDIEESDMHAVEQKMVQISEKLHNLKCQIETYSYLSWLGFAEAPQAGKVAVPSQNAPPSNPQLHLIRRPDSDVRLTVDEYNRLCNRPISDRVRTELRCVTFNNWAWSDAWLIRFVRQMFVDLGFVQHFQLPLAVLDRWLCDVYRRYNRVPFHNYKHAFMVTQMCYAIIWNGNLTEALELEEQLTLIVAAICHDLDHPGFNNAYQINAGTALALRYNDQSPLENHHAAMAFDVLGRKETNPFAHLDPETYRRIREGIIRCILATDMSRHNEILEQFTSKVLEERTPVDGDGKKPTWFADKAKRDLVMMIILKVSDISNEARPLNVAGPWINRLLAEFFNQSDYEKLVGLPVAPFMDREKVTKATSQCGFISFVILPLFEALARLLPSLKDIIVKPAHDQLNYYTEAQHQLDQEEVIEEAESQETNDESSDSKPEEAENDHMVA